MHPEFFKSKNLKYFISSYCENSRNQNLTIMNYRYFIDTEHCLLKRHHLEYKKRKNKRGFLIRKIGI